MKKPNQRVRARFSISLGMHGAGQGTAGPEKIRWYREYYQTKARGKRISGTATGTSGEVAGADLIRRRGCRPGRPPPAGRICLLRTRTLRSIMAGELLLRTKRDQRISSMYEADSNIKSFSDLQGQTVCRHYPAAAHYRRGWAG